MCVISKKVMTETMISNDLAYIRCTYVVYKINRTRPRTDPCSSHIGRCFGQDSVSDGLMLWRLSEKYNFNHRRAVPEIKISNNTKMSKKTS